MSNIEIEVSEDADFTTLVVTENGFRIAQYRIEHHVVPAVYAALCEHLDVGLDDAIHFFPLCDACPNEQHCLERGSCFFEDAYTEPEA